MNESVQTYLGAAADGATRAPDADPATDPATAPATAPAGVKIDRGFVAGPAWLGIAAAVLLIAVGEAGPAGVLAGAAMLAAGLWTGRRLGARARAGAERSASDASRDASRGAGDLVAASVPVWIRQIDTARGEADGSVEKLAELFSGIVAKLERVLRASTGAAAAGDAGRGGLIAEIDRGKGDLNGVIQILRSVQDAKDAIVAKVNANAADLKAMTVEIHQIALQVRLLTLNAAIEAARSGEAGKPFAVIVSDMRQLAARSADVSGRISRQVQALDATISSAFRGDGSGADAGTTSAQRAETAVRQVVERFETAAAGLSDSLDAMERERGVLRADISNALVLLQFQDRVSQILSHVARDLEELPRHLEHTAAGDSGAEDWIEQMARGYTTAEEFDNLRGARPRDARSAADVTFF